jgi:hypothetical protein
VKHQIQCQPGFADVTFLIEESVNNSGLGILVHYADDLALEPIENGPFVVLTELSVGRRNGPFTEDFIDARVVPQVNDTRVYVLIACSALGIGGLVHGYEFEEPSVRVCVLVGRRFTSAATSSTSPALRRQRRRHCNPIGLDAGFSYLDGPFIFFEAVHSVLDIAAESYRSVSPVAECGLNLIKVDPHSKVHKALQVRCSWCRELSGDYGVHRIGITNVVENIAMLDLGEVVHCGTPSLGPEGSFLGGVHGFRKRVSQRVCLLV